MFWPFCCRKSLLVEENRATSTKRDLIFCSFWMNVRPVVTLLRSRRASSGVTAR
jgi:hypothetical protein